jgi:hypothetical protein
VPIVSRNPQRQSEKTDFEVSNCIYTTEYLKLRTGARSDAIEFRRFDGRILSRQADMLRTMTEQEWHEVDAMQLESYRTKFPAMIQWLTLIGYGKSF